MGISSSASFLCPTRKENSPESKQFPQSLTKSWWLKSLPSSVLQVIFGWEWNLMFVQNESHTTTKGLGTPKGIIVHYSAAWWDWFTPSHCCQLPGLTHGVVLGGASHRVGQSFMPHTQVCRCCRLLSDRHLGSTPYEPHSSVQDKVPAEQNGSNKVLKF